MSRVDDLNKQKMIAAWRVRTGNATWKGTHKDSKTREAEARMKRRPYYMKGES